MFLIILAERIWHLIEDMVGNRSQSAADVADATRAAFHLTASAHPTKIKYQKMSEITFYKALDRLSTADFYFKSKKRKASSGRFFEIERVVSKRVKAKMIFLVTVLAA